MTEQLTAATNTSVKFWSFAWSRLVAASILLVMSGIQLAEFGAELFFKLGDGNWLFLGGPSLWYATNMFITPMAVGLLIHAIGSTCHVSVTLESGDSIVQERRFGLIRRTRVSIDEITDASLDNVGPGLKWLWAIPLGLSSWYLGVDGVAYFTNPHGFGRGPITGAYFLAQVVANLASLALLLLWHQHRLAIRTGDHVHVLAFSPAWNAAAVFNRVTRAFNMSRVDPRGGRKYPARLVAGASFIALAIISRTWWLFWGDPVRIVLFIGGLVLLFHGTKVETGSPVHRVATTREPWDAGKRTRGFDITFSLFLSFTTGATLSALFLLWPAQPAILAVFTIELGLGTAVVVMLCIACTGIPRERRPRWITHALIAIAFVAGMLVGLVT